MFGLFGMTMERTAKTPDQGWKDGQGRGHAEEQHVGPCKQAEAFPGQLIQGYARLNVQEGRWCHS